MNICVAFLVVNETVTVAWFVVIMYMNMK